MAREFDGTSSQYLRSATTPLSAWPMTLAAWVYADALENYDTALCVTGGTNQTGAGIVIRSTGAVQASCVLNSATNAAVTTATLSTGGWYHVCGVFAGDSSRSIYLSGANKITNTTTATPQTFTRIGIGHDHGQFAGRYIDGRIAFPCIWNIALSDSDVAALAVSGTDPRTVQAANVVACWLLDGSSPEADSVGSYDMTVTGATHAADPFTFSAGSSRRISSYIFGGSQMGHIYGL